MSNRTPNPWDLDIRVRERNIRAGLIQEKDVEKHLHALPDLAEQVESFSLAQPALDGEDEVDEEGDEDQGGDA
ncbi:MAG: hypothetical protein JNL38_29280 [Myxococcales bacterium]|jgi:hypothetical protein|nr:hypothetical protein [Myxococcales bacterium]